MKLPVAAPSGAHLQNFLIQIKPEVSQFFVINDIKPDVDFEIGFSQAFLSLRKILRFSETIHTIQRSIEVFMPDVIHAHQLGRGLFMYCHSMGIRCFNTS